LPKLIHGQHVQLSTREQRALASWSVVTVLLLQHTHSRAARLVIPASDYAGVYETKSPTTLMKVFTGYLEPPGRGSRAEASAEYLAEDKVACGSKLPRARSYLMVVRGSAWEAASCTSRGGAGPAAW
jgi:hypothetical protein